MRMPLMPLLGSAESVTSDAAVVSHLSLLQLSDSSFPSGRYTLSHGLEALAQSGRFEVGDTEATLTSLLADCIRFAIAPTDGTALACAHRAVARDVAFDIDLASRADARLTAAKLAREPRETSIRTGRALLGTASVLVGEPLRRYAGHVREGRAPGNHAIVLGLVCAELGVPAMLAVTGELYAFSASWAAAAVRLGVIDHRAAQRVLHSVRPVTAAAARTAVAHDVSHIRSCTPLLDVMSMRHEQADLRLFAS